MLFLKPGDVPFPALETIGKSMALGLGRGGSRRFEQGATRSVDELHNPLSSS